MDAIPASIPFHLAKAYAVPLSRVDAPRDSGARPKTPSPQAAPASGPDAFMASSSALDRANLAARAKKATLAPLVGARVAASPMDELNARATKAAPGPSNSPTARTASPGARGDSSPAAFPLYRHPADKNAAATGVDAGRRFDTMG